MQKLLLLLSCYLLLSGMSCKKHVKLLYPIELQYNHELVDLDYSTLLKDRRIIAIGESSHGLAEFYRLKSQLVNKLHEDHGYDVLALEGGLGDINLAWFNADTMDAPQLRENTVFSNFSAKEVQPMFEKIIDSKGKKKELIYTGFDSQLSSNFFRNSLSAVLERYDPGLLVQLNAFEDHYYQWYQCGMQQDSVCYYLHRNAIAELSDKAAEVITTNRDEIAKEQKEKDLAVEVMIRTLKGMKKSTNVPYEQRWLAIQQRDQVMFENLVWLIDTIYPDKKFIIWAHNAHIEKAPVENGYFTWMGHLLKEKYGDDYFSIGLFAYEGEAYMHWSQDTIAFKNSGEEYIESHLEKYDRNTVFIPISDVESAMQPAFVNQSLLGREFENGDTVRFIPSKRFDALIQVDYSGVPTYEN